MPTLLSGGDGACEVVTGCLRARSQPGVRERHQERLPHVVGEPEVAVAHAQHDRRARRPHAFRRQAAGAIRCVVHRALQRCERHHLRIGKLTLTSTDLTFHH